MAISRRSLLKSGLMASASIPFFNVGTVIDQWRTDEYVDVTENAKGTIVKLNSNENPYGPSDKAREAIIEAISAGSGKWAGLSMTTRSSSVRMIW